MAYFRRLILNLAAALLRPLRNYGARMGRASLARLTLELFTNHTDLWSAGSRADSMRFLRFKEIAKILVVGLPCVTLACGGRSYSSIKVIGGEVIDDTDYPYVVGLEMDGGKCTGTFVSDTTLITAAHCVVDTETVTVMENSAVSTKIMFHRKYDDSLSQQQYDLAVVLFPTGSAPAWTSLVSAPFEEGDEATIIGYGCTDWKKRRSSGVRRLGTTYVVDVNEETGVIKSNLRGGASVCPGDSGGPLLAGEFVGGIASTGNKEKLNSKHANVLSYEAFKFFARAERNGAVFEGGFGLTGVSRFSGQSEGED